MDPSELSRGLVVVAEDEPRIAELERLYLTREGFGVHLERDGALALEAVRRLRPVALVLDAGLPSLDGFEVLRRLREVDDWTPTLMVTARDEEEDRLTGLGIGADDYVTKPFSPRELVARLNAVLRRTHQRPGSDVAEHGGLRVDLAGQRVHLDGVELALTPTERGLLLCLVRHAGQALSRDQLLSQVWGYTAIGGTRTVDVHVAQLRARLGPAAELVTTVRGFGYRFDPT